MSCMLHLYSGKTYNDQQLIDSFPFKYKSLKRLQELKKLMFYIASHCGHNNGEVFFTQKTFDNAGVHNVSPMQQSNWIKGMVNCGLLTIVNKHYQFNHGEDNFSKLYSFNQIGVIKSYYDEYQEYCNTVAFKKAELDHVKKIDDNVTVELYRKEDKRRKNPAAKPKITVAMLNLFTKGTLLKFRKMLAEYNEGKSPYNKKTFKFKYDGKEITGRAYSQYIATKNDDDYETDRTVWCRANNLCYRYDIKSAVPKVSHLLFTGEWWGGDVDFYKTLLEESDMDISREQMKSMHMRVRFSKSAKKAYNDFCFSNKKLISKRFSTQAWLTEVKDQYFVKFKKLYDITEKYEGKDHSSAVFYFESFIELYVVWKLKKMGVTAYNVYDEFYYDKECDIKSLIREGAECLLKEMKDVH